MKSEIKEKGYKIIKNFISKDLAKSLALDFEEYCKSDEIHGDCQVENSKSVYNYISFLDLLNQKTAEVSEILGDNVLPTYSYARVYKNKNVLETHKDRESCEISLTVHLDGDSEWEFYIGNENKESIKLNSGDAILYLGCDVEHGREEYQGNKYIQCFLHYVRTKGEYSDFYFDSKKHHGKYDIRNYIKVYENVVPDELCDQILSEYCDDEWVASYLGKDNLLDTDVRSCTQISISLPDSISKNKKNRESLDNQIFECAKNAIIKYCTDFSNLEISTDTGYVLLRYEEGQFYKQHIDTFKEQQRALSCSFILNDDYDGGEFAFFDEEIKLKPKKGSVIMFPSNFMYPHEILPVQKGTRYSIITWFV
jgi:Rps23 Pro-64 3,4-dihydroxylase Tpa1-like proline 4-hydroxylase